MSMIDWTTPGETEMGSAGEQPIKGYPGQAHQTMSGRGVTRGASPTNPSSDDRPVMPQKTHPENCGTGRKLVSKEPGAVHGYCPFIATELSEDLS